MVFHVQGSARRSAPVRFQLPMLTMQPLDDATIDWRPSYLETVHWSRLRHAECRGGEKMRNPTPKAPRVSRWQGRSGRMPYSKRPGNRGRHPRGCMCAGCTNRRMGNPTGVSVAFPRDEFTIVVGKAREVGMTTSGFIRDAALEKARASGRVLAIYWGGSAIESGSFVAQIDLGPRTQGLAPPSTFSYPAPAAATG